MPKEETVRFLVTIPKRLHEEAKKAAESDLRDLSKWVRLAIEDKLGIKETDRLKRLLKED